MFRVNTGGNAILKWKLDDSEILFGADASMIEIMTAAEAAASAQAALSDVFNLILPTSNRAGVYFKLTSGYWSFNGYSSVASQYATFSILKTGALIDAIIAQGDRSSTDFTVGGLGAPDNANPAKVTSPPVKIEESDVLYVAHGDGIPSGTYDFLTIPSSNLSWSSVMALTTASRFKFVWIGFGGRSTYPYRVGFLSFRWRELGVLF